ncbi:Cysteine protease atg4b, partial [Ilyodon furcidens]
MGAGWEWESIYQEWDGTGFVFYAGLGLGWDKTFFCGSGMGLERKSTPVSPSNVKLAVFDTWSRLVVHVAMDNTVIIEEIKRLCMPWLDLAGEAEGEGEVNGCLEGACALAEETALWKPLVLLIPLRLGLSDINEAYIETLK